MKTATFLSIRSLALTAAVCLLAAALAAAPASAAPVAPPDGSPGSSADTAAVPKPRNETDHALLVELAARARAKALFAAQTTPKLAEALRQAGYSRVEDATAIINALWDLRVAPAVQAKWLTRLSGSASTEKQRINAFYTFEDFMEDTRRLAMSIKLRESDNLWTKLTRLFFWRSQSPSQARDDLDDPRHIYEKTRRELEAAKAREGVFAQALTLKEALDAVEVRSSRAARYIPQLQKFADKPDDLALAVSLLKQDITRDLLSDLLLKLDTNPEEARKDIAEQRKTAELEDRYLYALHDEGVHDHIQLPVESLLPGMNKVLGKRGTVALSARPVTEPEKSLRFTDLEVLVPDGTPLEPGQDGSLPALPFLLPGEQLYMLDFGDGDTGGFPIFADTPLDSFARIGPRVVPFTPETASSFTWALTPEKQAELWNNSAVIAAGCGPEELAAHLGSLAVIYGSREKSLYGAYNDFLHTTGDPDHGGHSLLSKGGYPKDVPGDTYRLTNMVNGELFLALAPVADKNGLERLMGPIRGIWVTGNAPGMPTPLREMRYTPKSGPVKMHTLGASPVLSLSRNNLNALVAATQKRMVMYSTAHSLREAAKSDEGLSAERWNEALQKTTEKYDALRAKGFISPLDMGRAIYYLEQHADDPELEGKLRAILDDRTLSTARRINAMRGVITERR